MSLASTVALWQLLRNRILGFTTPDGHAVASQLGSGKDGKLYYVEAPANAVTPYAVGRLINRQVTHQGARERSDLEIMLYDRPRARMPMDEELADWIKGALNGYRAPSSSHAGFVMVNPPSSEILPVTPSPGDTSLVTIQIVAEVIAYPHYLTQYAIPGS